MQSKDWFSITVGNNIVDFSGKMRYTLGILIYKYETGKKIISNRQTVVIIVNWLYT